MKFSGFSFFLLLLLLLDLFQCSSFRIDDETSDYNILWYKWMGLDGFNSLANRGWRIFEPFQPCVEIDTTLIFHHHHDLHLRFF